MKILAVDTSCDETAAAVTRGTTVLSNIVWSQASQHAKFGGVMPSLAQRMHEERIDWVINKAVLSAKCEVQSIEAIAVTAGPGLAIALGVGIDRARKLAEEHRLPLIPINHTEGHLLSPMAKPYHPSNSPLNLRGDNLLNKVCFPALGLVVSGGHTELVLMKNIGDYKILAKTQDDALGEALDKAARMLGLGYPGGAVLEKMAHPGNPKAYPLPLPMAGREDRSTFSYSGLKTSFYRLIESLCQNQSLSKTQVYDLAAGFQNRAFEHLTRVITKSIRAGEYTSIRNLLVGGGVAANVELRKRLRKMGNELGLRVRLPYSTRLVGDNAAMIGVAAGLRISAKREALSTKYEQVDRRARWSVEDL